VALVELPLKEVFLVAVEPDAISLRAIESDWRNIEVFPISVM